MPTNFAEYGPLWLLVFTLISGAGTCAWWIGTNILIPIKNDHKNFLDKLDGHIEKIADTQNMICDRLNNVPCLQTPAPPTRITRA